MTVRVNRAMQTEFRDSDTQTRPWTPPYVVISAEIPEVLTLTALKWGDGLPAGKPEVEIVERVRKKAAWERFMSTVHPSDQAHLRKRIVQHIEEDNWRFREKQLLRISEWRMELADKQMDQHRDHFREKASQLLRFRSDLWEAVKQETVKKIRSRLKKDLHRLTVMEEKNYHEIYRKKSIIDDLGSPNSAYRVVLARRGYHNRHMSLKLCKEAETAMSVHRMTIPRSKFELKSRATRVKKHDCLKETFHKISPTEMENYNNYLKKFWGVPEYKDRTRGLESFGLDTKGKASSVDYDDENEYSKYLSTVLLQKVLKGRAVQAVMQEGRWRNQGLIEELLSTAVLMHEDENVKEKQRQTVLNGFRRYCKNKARMERLMATIAYLRSNTITLIIKFATRELVRLQDEEKLLALAMLGQTERWQREAWEAGIRQKEHRRHRQRAEIYRQFVETIDKDLEDGMKASLQEALFSKGVLVAENVARSRFYKIERAANKINRSSELHQQEEMVSSLMSQVVLPETQRQEARSRISSKQDGLRCMARVSMYGREVSWRDSNIDSIRNQAEELVDVVLATAYELLALIGKGEEWDLEEHLEKTGFNLSSLPTLREMTLSKITSQGSSSTGATSSSVPSRAKVITPDMNTNEDSRKFSEFSVIGSGEPQPDSEQPTSQVVSQEGPTKYIYQGMAFDERCHCSDINLMVEAERF